MRYAIVKAGQVVNVTDWDGARSWAPPDGYELIRDESGEARTGGRWDGARFSPPDEVADRAAMLESALDARSQLLAALTLRAWPDATAAEKTWAANVIAQVGLKIREARA